MTPTVKVDMGNGPENVPVLAAPYILAGLPDFIALPKVTEKTPVDDPPLAAQIGHKDTSAASLAKLRHVPLGPIFKALGKLEYDSSWPRDSDTIRLFNASRDHARGVIRRGVRRAGQEHSETAITVAMLCIVVPLFFLFLWLGINLAADLRSDFLTFALILLAFPASALASFVVAILFVILLPARSAWYYLLSLCALGLFSYGFASEWHWALFAWVMEWRS